MASKLFRLNLLWRLALILIAGYAGVHFLLHTPYWMLSIWLFAIAVLLTVGMIRYAEKNYRHLGDFLMGIDQDDFSYLANVRKIKKDSRLGSAFNHIADLIEGLRLEAETSFQYLQTVVNHVEIGIVCYDEQGRISLFNKAARDLLGVSRLSHVRFLQKSHPAFYQLIRDILPGERKLFRLEKEGRLYQLSVLATQFKKGTVGFKLISFQNIKGELEEKEMESWYRLTRVLTHEIMNSAIPISNLSGMVYETLVSEEGGMQDLENLRQDEADELMMSLRTIQSRSRGLVSFVNTTRRITRLPDPELQTTGVIALVKRVVSLYAPKMKEQGVRHALEVPPGEIHVKADPGQLEQVLINLVQNALDAVREREHPSISFRIRETPEDQTEIRIIDNGRGMSREVLENLFVPFYTTKKNGSGIGLSLSRHIIHNHRGKLEISSREGEGTEVFVIL